MSSRCEHQEWIDACDYFDRNKMMCVWYNSIKSWSIRYDIEHNDIIKCKWNWIGGRWDEEEKNHLVAKDPNKVKRIANKMLSIYNI